MERFCRDCGDRLSAGRASSAWFCKLCLDAAEALSSQPRLHEWIEKLALRNRERIDELRDSLRELGRHLEQRRHYDGRE
jgi:reverse gyrase